MSQHSWEDLLEAAGSNVLCLVKDEPFRQQQLTYQCNVQISSHLIKSMKLSSMPLACFIYHKLNISILSVLIVTMILAHIVTVKYSNILSSCSQIEIDTKF